MKNLLFYILFVCFFGSFAQKSIPNKVEMCELLSEMINNDQLHRSKTPDSFSKHKRDFNDKEIDSMNVLQRQIDDRNTEKLIALTRTYGWISDERIDCPDLNAWLIFRHSQKKYFEEISVLIEKEHNAKRLNDFHYGLIYDHLKGRPRG